MIVISNYLVTYYKMLLEVEGQRLIKINNGPYKGYNAWIIGEKSEQHLATVILEANGKSVNIPYGYISDLYSQQNITKVNIIKHDKDDIIDFNGNEIQNETSDEIYPINYDYLNREKDHNINPDFIDIGLIKKNVKETDKLLTSVSNKRKRSSGSSGSSVSSVSSVSSNNDNILYLQSYNEYYNIKQEDIIKSFDNKYKMAVKIIYESLNNIVKYLNIEIFGNKHNFYYEHIKRILEYLYGENEYKKFPLITKYKDNFQTYKELISKKHIKIIGYGEHKKNINAKTENELNIEIKDSNKLTTDYINSGFKELYYKNLGLKLYTDVFTLKNESDLKTITASYYLLHLNNSGYQIMNDLYVNNLIVEHKLPHTFSNYYIMSLLSNGYYKDLEKNQGSVTFGGIKRNLEKGISYLGKDGLKFMNENDAIQIQTDVFFDTNIKRVAKKLN